MHNPYYIFWKNIYQYLKQNENAKKYNPRLYYLAYK